jgi:dTDP-4-dehydrorhamnose 3,5-epimerase
VPPGIWFGFQGIAAPFSLVLNVGDIPHDPHEVVRKPLEAFRYDWGA